MGMSTHVIGFISDEDPTYQKHKKVLIACHEAGVPLPEITSAYFNDRDADLYLLDQKLEIELPLTEYNDDGSQGYELLVNDIPVGVSRIRFYNSW